ncbi:MAG: dihydrolipoyl dehydrogenase [Planctomycetota bacterium]|nr:dihydrolipoyl dehydrogenase [Planctomycetota bacterium]
MTTSYDVVVIGAGPGGYVAAIKAAQMGKTVAVIEREALGGVCLNWGCIPTKALIKSAETFSQLQHVEDFGVTVGKVGHNWAKVVERSRSVAAKMSTGVDFLMKKNKIDVIMGSAKLVSPTHVEVTSEGESPRFVQAGSVVIATGARARTFPNLPVDGDRVFHYRKAMVLDPQPKSLLCIGAGAIGMEFAYVYNSFGTEVHVVEVMDQVLPVEDHEIAKFVERAYKKQGVHIHTKTKVKELKVGKKSVKVVLESGDKEQVVEVERVLVAVGMQPNTEGLGLSDVGVKLDARGFVDVDANQQTSVPGVYAIGDCAGKQLLAHKASVEGEAAVYHICGQPHPVDHDQIPGNTYCQPQVSSIGLSERKAKELGKKVKIGRFNFQASGMAQAIGHPEGFIKLVFDAQYDQLVGAHMVGYGVTELIGELGLALKLEATAAEIQHTVHAHPSLAEAVMETAGDALGQAIHQ